MIYQTTYFREFWHNSVNKWRCWNGALEICIDILTEKRKEWEIDNLFGKDTKKGKHFFENRTNLVYFSTGRLVLFGIPFYIL